MRLRLLVLIIAGLLFVGGGAALGFRISQQRMYEDTVREYNRRLAEALEKRDATLLRGVAAEWERVRVRLHYETMAAQNLYMVSYQEGIKFLGTAKKGGKVTVDTVENWRYELRDLSSGKIQQGPERVENRLRYYLTKEEGKWVVERVENLKK